MCPPSGTLVSGIALTTLHIAPTTLFPFSPIAVNLRAAERMCFVPGKGLRDPVPVSSASGQGWLFGRALPTHQLEPIAIELLFSAAIS